jgi:hypothetical protein
LSIRWFTKDLRQALLQANGLEYVPSSRPDVDARANLTQLVSAFIDYNVELIIDIHVLKGYHKGKADNTGAATKNA